MFIFLNFTRKTQPNVRTLRFSSCRQQFFRIFSYSASYKKQQVSCQAWKSELRFMERLFWEVSLAGPPRKGATDIAGQEANSRETPVASRFCTKATAGRMRHKSKLM
jgi:hypothetical protein